MHPCLQHFLGIYVFSHHHCHISLHHCHPHSRHQHHSASGWGCNGHFCTGTDRYRTSHHSHSGPRQRFLFVSAPGMSNFKAGCQSGRRMSDTSSEPSAQSWSPSHFQRPAMQRPFVQANSLSEHCRGTEDRDKSLGGWERRNWVGTQSRGKEQGEVKGREEKGGNRADGKKNTGCSVESQTYMKDWLMGHRGGDGM